MLDTSAKIGVMLSHELTAMPYSGGDLQTADPFFYLASDAVEQILESEDPETFLRWMRDVAPSRHPWIFTGLPDVEQWPAYATTLGLGLWNAMPLPRCGFRPEPLGEPDLDEGCRCRSGQSYGACCARRPPPPDLASDVLWEEMVIRLEDDELLSASMSGQMPAHLLVGLVDERLQAGDPYEAYALLEPIFQPPELFELRAGEWIPQLLDLFDTLCATLALRERWHELLSTLVAHGSSTLRSRLAERLG